MCTGVFVDDDDNDNDGDNDDGLDCISMKQYKMPARDKCNNNKDRFRCISKYELVVVAFPFENYFPIVAFPFDSTPLMISSY